jgi:hypothetical protein
MQISTRTRAVGVSLGAALVLTTGLVWAQEPATSQSSKVGAPSARRNSDPTRRVPDFFGQIGLTPVQRETIYKIRGTHQARIDELEKQVVEIQAQMLVECEGVLTDTQRQLLTQRRAAAGARVKAEEPEKVGKSQNRSSH